MRDFLGVLLVSFLITSCCKPILRETFIIKNESSHSVQINKLRADIIVFALTIPPSSSVETLDLYSIEDSTVIVFDGSVSSVHYSSIVKDPSNQKALRIDHARNIYNRKSYIVDEIDLACDGYDDTYTYQLTDQDYLDAVK